MGKCGWKINYLPVTEFFTVQSVSTSACSFIGQAAAVSQVNKSLQDPTSSYKNCGWESLKNQICIVDSWMQLTLLGKNLMSVLWRDGSIHLRQSDQVEEVGLNTLQRFNY